jgi:putative transposase
MARPPRTVIPGVPMHLVQRGNNRALTFRDHADLERFCDILCDASTRNACAVHAYVLMANHFHLLVTPARPDAPARLMQHVGRTFGPWMNARQRRTGAIWEGRYRSSIIDSARYFFTCSRYIELNPVRAGLVTAPDGYSWSSYGRNACGVADCLVTPHPLYESLGTSDAERQSAYRSLFSEPIAIDAIDVLRRATRRSGRSARAGDQGGV